MQTFDDFKFSPTVEKVVIRLQGGLGNQMFQYALGETIKQINGLDIEYLCVEKPFFGKTTVTKRKLDIKDFSQVDSRSISTIKNLFGRSNFESVVRNRYARNQVEVKKEFEQTKKNQPLTLRSKVVALEGYWQSEYLFLPSKHHILSTYMRIRRPSDSFKKLSRFISEEGAIGIHIRRGDYVSHEKSNRFHGVCSQEYFDKSMAFLTGRVGNRPIVIFSDDPTWTRSNIVKSNRILISDEYQLRASEELLLLSKCSNLVLSNSSFSWWGAYLREESDSRTSIIVAPDPWFKLAAHPSISRKHWVQRDIQSGLDSKWCDTE